MTSATATEERGYDYRDRSEKMTIPHDALARRDRLIDQYLRFSGPKGGK